MNQANNRRGGQYTLAGFVTTHYTLGEEAPRRAHTVWGGEKEEEEGEGRRGGGLAMN